MSPSEMKALTSLTIMCFLYMTVPRVATKITFGHYEQKYHGIRPELAAHSIGTPVTVDTNCELMHVSVATNSCTLYDAYMSDDQPDLGGVYTRNGAIDQNPARPLVMLGNISVDNGDSFDSTWGEPEYCEYGTYAYSYDLKIEAIDGDNGDNTALNAIKLNCTSLDLSVHGGSITSATIRWGDWRGESECPDMTFITGFTLQVEPTGNDADGDRTAANWVKVKCRDFAATTASVEMTIHPGYGNWGTFGSWSSECGANSAVCGIRTRVQIVEGTHVDDTAVNDVVMYCCA